MLNFLFKSKPDYINFGLLFYRLALGISMFYHGYLKYVSGEQGLYKVGAMLSALGVPSGFEVILGTIASYAEISLVGIIRPKWPLVPLCCSLLVQVAIV